jgi:tRNA 2-thiouridine synthesizing protein A
VETVSRLTCDEAMREFFAYLDRALSGEASEDMEAHLEECLSCCDKLAFSRQLDGFVKARLAESEPPDDLEQRIRERLAAAAVTRMGSAAGPPAADHMLDGGSRACGELLIAIKTTLDGMRAGEVLKLMCHDPGAQVDLPVWCRMTRHTLLWNDETTYYIRRRDQ